MRAQYLVATTLGDSLMDSDSETYVQVSPRSYLRKKIADLNVGDMVLYDKAQTRTEIEDVEPYFPRSPRYALAREVLHEKNSEGQYIPRLRTLLTRGLSERGVISSDDLERRLLHETEDFSKEEYKAMTEYVSDVLTSNGFSRGEGTIEKWLSGETLAVSPKEWEIYAALAKDVNPEFSEFRPHEQDNMSMYFNYQTYVKTRSVVMRVLNKFKGTGGSDDENGSPPHERFITLSPEFQIILQHFINERGGDDEQFASARVTSLNKILKSRQVKYVRETNPRLGDGVVSQRLEKLDGSLVDYKGVLESLEVLQGYIGAFIEDFTTPEFGFSRSKKYSLSHVVLPFLAEKFGEDLDSVLLELKNHAKINPATSGSIFPSFAEFVSGAFLDRSIDTAFNYTPGTAISLLEQYYNIRRSMPRKYFDFLTNCGELERFLKSDTNNWQFPDQAPKIITHGSTYIIFGYIDQALAAKKISDLNLQRNSDVLEYDYGLVFNFAGLHYEGGVFLSDLVHDSLAEGLDPFKQGGLNNMHSLLSGREYLEMFQGDQSRLNFLIKNGPLKGVFLRTRAQTLQVLDEFNLGHIVDRRWQDFVWEDLAATESR